MQIAEILADLKKGAGKFDVGAGVSQALTLTQECLFIFATCKNLYLTNVNEDLKDEVGPLKCGGLPGGVYQQMMYKCSSRPRLQRNMQRLRALAVSAVISAFQTSHRLAK